ncbi:actin family [Pelomyxa schiedti]|nr:actin family [Pelomyxa schiedti]
MQEPGNNQRAVVLRSSGTSVVDFEPCAVLVSVRVAGFLAETEVTCQFTRPIEDALPDDIECYMMFPLGERSTVCGYAVDVDGNLVEAVVVPKDKARAAFESEVREKRAAAIAEQVEGNIFRVRIHPFRHGMSRTIKLVITEALEPSLSSATSYTHTFSVPLHVLSNLHLYSFKAVVATGQHTLTPVVYFDSIPASMHLVPSGKESISVREYILETELRDTHPPKATLIELIHPTASDVYEVISEAGSNAVFFCAQVMDSIKFRNPGLTLKRPEQVLLLWDTSRSSSDFDKTREFGVIKSLESLGAIPVTVTTFADQIVDEKEFTASQYKEILEYISGTVKDGATNIGSACLRASVSKKNTLCLLFSDGFSNWGKNKEEEKCQFPNPIFTLTSSAQANFSLLKRIAIHSGAFFINLNNSKSALDEILQPSMHFMYAADSSGRKMPDFFPSTPRILSFPFPIVGSTSPSTEDQQIFLHFQSSSREELVTRLEISKNPTNVTSGVVARFWAQQHVEELQLFYEQNDVIDKKVLHLARTYHFVTANASLIILETLEQYLRHGIEPPETLPNIRRQYLVQIALTQAELEKKTTLKGEKVFDMWKRRIFWWNSNYDGKTLQPQSRYFLKFASDTSRCNTDEDFILEMKSLSMRGPDETSPIGDVLDTSRVPTFSTGNNEVSETIRAVVIDAGHGFMKCGFSGKETPSSVFPTIVGRPGYHSHSPKDSFVGHDVYSVYHEYLSIKSPFSNGMVNNWDDMEKIWHYTFYNELRVAPEETPTLLTETPLNPKMNREKTCQLMFETFNTPAIYQTPQPPLSLYTTGRTTGMVLDIGDDTFYASPVYEAYTLPHAVQKCSLAGTHITDYLTTLLAANGSPTFKRTILEDIKESLCFVALDPQQPQLSSDDESSIFTLPDGQTLSLQNTRFEAPELLFNPSLGGLPAELSTPTLLETAILKCDADIRRSLWGNIVLAGGSTLLNGFQDRLLKEMKALAPTSTVVKVIAKPERRYNAWIGGSILSALESFQQSWTSKEEYDESGPAIVHRKCFGGDTVVSPIFSSHSIFTPSNQDLKAAKPSSGELLQETVILPSVQSTGCVAPTSSDDFDSSISPIPFPEVAPLSSPKLSTTLPSKPLPPPSVLALDITRGCLEQADDDALEDTNNNNNNNNVIPKEEAPPEAPPALPKKGGKGKKIVAASSRLHTPWDIQPILLTEKKPSRRTPICLSRLKFTPSSTLASTEQLKNDAASLHSCESDDIYTEFLSIISARPSLRYQTIFVLHAAIVAFHRNNDTAAKRILSNLVESTHDDVSILRAVSSVLIQFHHNDIALYLLEKVLQLRPEQPQSYRDLALVLVETEDETTRNDNLKRAIELLNEVIEKTWETRFDQIEIVALMEINSIHSHLASTGALAEIRPNIDARMLSDVRIDLRVVLSWNTDNTDVELIITEPSTDVCNSFNNHTRSGGLMSRNFSSGMGPTEWLVKKARPGLYTIQVKLHHSPNPSLTTVCSVSVFADYCDPKLQTCISRCTAFVSQSDPLSTVGTVLVPAGN